MIPVNIFNATPLPPLPPGEGWGERSEGPGIKSGNPAEIYSLSLALSRRERGFTFFDE